MITWPPQTLLPPPSVNFGVAVNSSTIRTKMDSGRVRQRARFTRNMRQITASWKFSDDERGLFQSLYAHALTNGADWFTMSLPLGGGFKDYRVRFIADSYSEKYDEVMYWDVSAKLETEDQTEMYDTETTGAIVAIDYDIEAFELAVARVTETCEYP